jgi:hypothetical protein
MVLKPRQQYLLNIEPQFRCWVIPMIVDGHWTLALITKTVLLSDSLRNTPGRRDSIRDAAQAITVVPGGSAPKGLPCIVGDLKRQPRGADSKEHCPWSCYLPVLNPTT